VSVADALVRSEAFGPVAPSLGWAPPLRYLLRRDRVLRLVRALPAGDCLEVGCGAGALIDELAHAGWRALGVESSARALSVARALREASGGGQRLADALDPDASERWDLVCALDVLEHIEDDAAAVRDWVARLRPGGHLLLSVPAHPSRWSAGDEWAGHFRRYARGPLLALLEGSGLAPVHVECYGFPLANLSEALGAPVYRRMMRQRDRATTKAEATADSGVERRAAARLFRWLSSPPGRLGLWAALRMQAATAGRDWGSGYLVLARRS
jgi:SAM-dependent methyltransferase